MDVDHRRTESRLVNGNKTTDGNTRSEGILKDSYLKLTRKMNDELEGILSETTMKYCEGKLLTLDTEGIEQLQNGEVRREGGIDTIVDNEWAGNETRDRTEGYQENHHHRRSFQTILDMLNRLYSNHGPKQDVRTAPRNLTRKPISTQTRF